MTPCHCGAPVGFGQTRCNTETCYLQRIASLQAQLAAALAVVEKADLFRQAMENIWTEDGFTSGEAEVANAFDAAREALRVLRVLSGKE